jgi:hypothetical protein
LNLVEVDREQNRVVYREENLWVQHVAPESTTRTSAASD